MKQDPNELRVAVEYKSIKVGGFSTREQLCVFVVGCYLSNFLQFVCISFCICTSVCLISIKAYQRQQCLYMVGLIWSCVLICVCYMQVKQFLEPHPPSSSTPPPTPPEGREDGRQNTYSCGMKPIFRYAPPSCAGVHTCTCV